MGKNDFEFLSYETNNSSFMYLGKVYSQLYKYVFRYFFVIKNKKFT